MRNSAFVKRLWDELPGLVASGVIDGDAAARLRQHYGEPPARGNLLMLAFSILGSLLIGGGIILLIAHNWDDFSKPVRAAIGLTPLIACQVLALYALKSGKREESLPWSEGVGIAWHLSVPTALAVVSQTYNLGGTLKDFLLGWSLLSLAVPFLSGSAGAAVLSVIAGISWLFSSSGPFFLRQGEVSPALGIYGFLVLSQIPIFLKVYREDREGARVGWISTAFAAAFLFGVVFSAGDAGLFAPLLLATSAALWRITTVRLFDQHSPFPQNRLRAFGAPIVALCIFVFSYEEVWMEMLGGEFKSSVGLYALFIAVLGLWGFFALKTFREGDWGELAIGALPIVVLAATLGALAAGGLAGAVVINLYGLLLGVYYIVAGAKNSSVSLVNGGMALVAVLAFLRFVDLSQDMITRGVVLILLGAGFLAINRKISAKSRGRAVS